jgi:hypothetical protein
MVASGSADTSTSSSTSRRNTNRVALPAPSVGVVDAHLGALNGRRCGVISSGGLLEVGKVEVVAALGFSK